MLRRPSLAPSHLVAALRLMDEEAVLIFKEDTADDNFWAGRRSPAEFPFGGSPPFEGPASADQYLVHD